MVIDRGTDFLKSKNDQINLPPLLAAPLFVSVTSKLATLLLVVIKYNNNKTKSL